MQPHSLGTTGVQVYPIGLGVMPLSTRSSRPDRDGALAVFKAALDAGVDFWDTANAYCHNDKETGHNERLIAWAIARLGCASRVRVATKGGFTRPRGAWVTDGRPERLKRACEQSLKELGVQRIFLYQFHWPDTAVPFAESMGALADLQREGKVEHVGVSNVSAAQLREAQGIVTVQSVQNECSPTVADDLRNGLVKRCGEARVTYIAYSPVGGQHGHQRLGKHKVLGEIGKAHGVSAYQVALAWLRAKGAHVLPIPGASRPQSIADSAAAARLALSAEELRRVDAMGR